MLVGLLLSVAGCTSARKPVSFEDRFDGVTVEQAVANRVSGAVFQEAIVCLNPRRETFTLLSTNQTVLPVTNVSVSYVTNEIVTTVASFNRSVSTNQLPEPTVTTNQVTGAETNLVILITNVPPASLTTNVTVSEAGSRTGSRGPNLVVTSANAQISTNLQVSLTTNNLSIVSIDYQAVTTETNRTVSALTNAVIALVTNVTERQDRLTEHFLWLEVAPPPDFVVQTSEPLVLLIDGERHVFPPGNSRAALVGRRGYVSALFKASADTFDRIADATEVLVRVRGSADVIEKRMSRRSLRGFREFLDEHRGSVTAAR
jgi:hypothetical protein